MLIPNVVLYLAMRGLNHGRRMDDPRCVQAAPSAPAEQIEEARALIRAIYPSDPVLLEINSAYHALTPTEKQRTDWTAASLAFVNGQGDEVLRILWGQRRSLGSPGIERPPGELPAAEPELAEEPDSMQITQTVRAMIRSGESERVEFKSTLRWDLEQRARSKEITGEVLKTICAFLNNRGGNLLVGVDDQGRVLGLEADRFRGRDECLRFVADVVRDRIGAEAASYVRAYVAPLDEGEVLVVNCRPGVEPVFLGDDFIVRNGPTSIRLTPRESVRFVMSRPRRAA